MKAKFWMLLVMITFSSFAHAQYYPDWWEMLDEPQSSCLIDVHIYNPPEQMTSNWTAPATIYAVIMPVYGCPAHTAYEGYIYFIDTQTLSTAGSCMTGGPVFSCSVTLSNPGTYMVTGAIQDYNGYAVSSHYATAVVQ